VSDRNAKAGFSPVQADEVLDGVLSLPLSKWHYKSEPPEIQHIGPMAQDFKAAFGVGADDKHIFQIDADGVSFAAIQALSRKLETLAAAQRTLERDNADLLAHVQQLETQLATARAGACLTQ
jgi:hypothetical protein